MNLAYVRTLSFDLILLMLLILTGKSDIGTRVQSEREYHFCIISAVLLQALQIQFSPTGCEPEL